MLRFIWSRPGRGGRSRLLSDITEAARRGERSIWLTPEPYSHACERTLAETGGPGICLHAEVLTFARLCDTILTGTGGLALPVLDAGGRLLTLRRALSQTAPSLKHLAGAAARSGFLEALAETLDECKCYGITPALLEQAAGQTEAAAAERLHELACIFGAYDALCAQGSMDSRDRTLLCAQKLTESDFGRGCHLFVSSFASFTPQELMVLRILSDKAAETVLLFEGEDDADRFPALVKTARQCERIIGQADAQRVDAPSAEIVPELRRLEEQWFTRPSEQPFPLLSEQDSPGIELWRAADAADECCFAAERIVRLVSKEGLRYRDISVLCSDEETYGPLVAALFPHYKIPLFQDRMDAFSGKSLYRLIEAIADCVLYGYRPADIMRLVRTDLTGVSSYSADRLEQYLSRWNFSGARFTGEDWKRSPSGFGQQTSPSNAAAQFLEKVNETRRFLVQGLKPMTAGSTARDCGERLLSALQLLKTPERLHRKRLQLTAQGEARGAAECTQMWGIFSGALEQTVALMDAEPMTPDAFMRLLLTALSAYSVGSIPATLDSVHCGALGRFARIPTKAVILLGASHDRLPAVGSPRGLLGLAERAALEGIDCNLPPDTYDRLDRELYNIYTACTLPTQRLIITYALSAQGDDLPAECVSHAAQTNACPIQDIPPRRYPRTGTPAPPSRDPVSPVNIVSLYGKDMVLSPSRIETWSGCQFAYFCKYGLKAAPPPAAGFRPTDVGSFLHDIMREAVEHFRSQGGLGKASEADVRQAVSAYTQQQTHLLFEQNRDVTKRLQAQGKRLLSAAEKMALDLHRELSASDFEPIYTEHKVTDRRHSFGTNPGGAASRQLAGVADRIDCYTDPSSGTYLRVIDYKSGKKTLSLTEMLYGKSLQMFMYLFSLCDNPPPALAGKTLLPAGVLYVPIREITLSTEKPVSAGEARKSERKALLRDGLILNDPKIFTAMDNNIHNDDRYLSLRLSKQGVPYKDSCIADQKQMKILKDFCANRLRTMASSIIEGNVPANPLQSGPTNSECDYCDYRAACHFSEVCDTAVRMQGINTITKLFEKLESEVTP